MENLMNESLFGAAPPPWQAVPVPAIGWPSSLLSTLSATRPLAGAASQVLASPLGLTSAMPAMLPPVSGLAGGVTPATSAMPVGATIASGSEVAVGVPVSSLLATVAVRRGQPLGPSNDQ